MVYDAVVPETGLYPVGEIQFTADLPVSKEFPMTRPFPGHGGAIIAAGIQEIKQGLDRNEPVQSDPGHLSLRERDEQKIRPLPSTLGEALSNLEKNKTLSDAMGDGLFKAYFAVKRAE